MSAILDRLAQQPAAEFVHALRTQGPIAESLTRLAEECEKAVISDLARAMSLTQALVATADAAGECRARARRARAQALAYSNRFSDAFDTLAEGILFAERAGESLEAAQCRLMSLHALARQGRFDEAIAMGEAAREAFVSAGESFHAARADINLGVTLRMKDDPAAALMRFDRALEHVKSVPMVFAQTLSNRAEALLDLHRFEEAGHSFARSLETLEQAGAQRAAAIVEGNLADLCGRQGRLDEALEHFEKARKRFGDADSPGDAARLEVERAETLIQLGALVDAERALLTALGELEPRGMAFEAARARAALGRVLLAQRRFLEAGVELGAARAGFDLLQHPTGTARVRLLLARALLGAGDVRGARQTLKELEDRADLRPTDRAETGAFVAIAATMVGEEAAARRSIDEAIERARSIGLPVLLAELFQHRAWICEQFKDGTGALESLRDSMDAVERVRSGLRGEQYRAVFSGVFAAVYEEYTRLWLDGGGNGATALETIERGRSRALHDLVDAGSAFSELSALSDDDAALLRRRGELLARIAALHQLIERPKGTMEVAATGRESSELESQLRDIEFRLAATRRFAGTFAQAPDAATIQREIPAGACLIEYFWDGPDISACVLRDGAIEVRRALCTQNEVRERLAALRLQLAMAASRGMPTGPRGAALAARAQKELVRLGELLLAPIWELCSGAGELGVVADDFLAGVPFQSLEVNGTNLIDLVNVTACPSAAVLGELSRRPDASGRTVVVGVADANAPLAEAECLRIAEIIRPTELLIGKDATVARVKEALRGATLVHIASHATFNAISPMQSALRLADGWLTSREVYGIELGGGTVVLSACDSGRTGVTPGRELLGLVRSFMGAGAKHLVLSQWLLHDETAATLLAEMYGVWYRWSGGKGGPHESLRHAQRVVRSSYPHVAAWGPLHVVGGWSGGRQ
jgi:tetratricopeptide (TPR) repeat protein